MHAVSSQSTAWKQGKIFYHVISARRYSARSNAVNRQLELYLKAVTRFGRRQDAVTSPLVKISSKILHVFFLNFSCDLPAIPGILQRHKHAKGTQLCVTVPL